MFGINHCFIQAQPSRCIVTPIFVLYAQKIRDMQVYEDDVWFISYPRTGSHWGLEMMWCIENGFDYEKPRLYSDIRNPLLEGSAFIISEDYMKRYLSIGDTFENVVKMPRPRYIKSHLPWALLPRELGEKKPKMIYMARNPKDTCVSFYHYCKAFHRVEGNFDDFAELMLQDGGPLSPFWDHVLEFWKMRKQEHMLFLTYEEMKQDQTAAIIKTAKFLGKNATPEQIAGLCEHLTFSRMASNPSLNLENLQSNKMKENPNNKFIRKGQVGDWMNYMSENLSQRFDEWSEKHLRETGLQFQDTMCNRE